MEKNEKVKQAFRDSIFDAFFSTLSMPTFVTEITGDLETLIGGGRSVVASIGFTGKMEGTLVIIFSDAAACKTVSKMLGTDLREPSQDVFDGIGEVSNILLGGLVRRCAEKDDHIDLSIPSVVHVDNPLSIVRWHHVDVVHFSVDCTEFKFVAGLSYVLDKKTWEKADKRVLDEKQKMVEKSLKDLIK